MFEYKVIAAAQWMEICASRLFEHFQEGLAQMSQLDRRVIRSSLTRFQESNVLSKERWKSWSEKFRDLAPREDLSEEARTHARLAAEGMNKWAPEAGNSNSSL
jgi:hypothetical protein